MERFAMALAAFMKQYPNINSGDIQGFALGWQACENFNPEISDSDTPSISNELRLQIIKNLKNKEFLAGEALELHEFLDNEGIPKVKVYTSEFPDEPEWVGIMPLIDRVIAYKYNK